MDGVEIFTEGDCAKVCMRVKGYIGRSTGVVLAENLIAMYPM